MRQFISRAIPSSISNPSAALPPMSRGNFRRELVTAACLPFAVSCMDMGVPGVVARKIYGAPSWVIALLEAAPFAAAVSSIFWASAMHGRQRVRFVTGTQLAFIACLALAALMPISAFGLAALVVLVVIARCCFIGMVTGRTELWRSNYPRNARTHATGTFTIVTTIALVVVTTALGYTLEAATADGNAVVAYRAFYLAAAGIALLGVWSYSRIRWRGGPAALRDEHNTEPHHRPGLRAMWRVMRDDHDYRRYMNAQMVMGFFNIAAMAPVVLVVTGSVFDLPYTYALAATAVLPKAMTIVAIPLWSRLLKRLHIVDFRAVHSWSFVLGNAMVGVAVLTLNVPLLLVARGLVGVGLAGGNLAWSLGHHDFAPRGKSNTYMGVHVLLTGIRGAIAPFVGVALFHWVGGWVFVLCAVGGAVGALMFVRMRKHAPRVAEDARG